MRLFGKMSLIIAILSIFCLPQVCWAVNATNIDVDFTDISGHWAKQPIEKVYSLGLIKGYEDNTFRPNQTVSCLEAITLVLNGAGYDDQIAKLKRSKNKPPSAYPVPWGQDYMDFAVQQKYIPETMLKGFRHDRAVSRGELAALITRTLYLAEPGKSVPFTDSNNIPLEYIPAVQAVNNNGIMSGYTDGSFRPQGSVSRGEMAAILGKLYDQGWVKLDAKRKIDGWVSAVTPGKKGIEIELNTIMGSKKIMATTNCKAYYQGRVMDLQQIVNYRVEGILDTKRKLAYLELLERRNFSPVQRDVYASYIRLAEGEPVILTVKDLLHEDVDYPIAWDAEVTDEKSKSKTKKDLLKKLKQDQFMKLGLTSNGTVKSITILDVKNITGEVDSIDRKLNLKKKGSGSSKKYVPDHFWAWDYGRLVDKEGKEISSIKAGDSVKIFYIGEPFYERVLEIQKLK